jgi:hypothetical protein
MSETCVDIKDAHSQKQKKKKKIKKCPPEVTKDSQQQECQR